MPDRIEDSAASCYVSLRDDPIAQTLDSLLTTPPMTGGGRKSTGEGHTRMRNVGKRPKGTGTLLDVEDCPDDDEALSIVVDQRAAFIAAVAEHLLAAATEKPFFYPEDAAALVLVEAPEPWLQALHGACRVAMGCRPIRLCYSSVGDRPDLKTLERQLSDSLAQSRSTAVLAHDLGDLPPYLVAVADLVLRLSTPTVAQVLATAISTGLPLVENDLDGIDLSLLTPALIDTAWRTPNAGMNAERVARALRIATIKPAVGPCLMFDDLPGLGEAAAWGRRLARDLRDYRSRNLAWGDVDSGLLLSGPPGTGKTKYAQALAHECGVPLIACSPAQWQASRDGHLGTTLRAMRESFEQARRAAPCILHLDELDSVGDRSTASWNRDYSVQVVNCLLECLDGVADRVGVVVLATTNHPDSIDAALLRAGRLDRHLRLCLPDAGARASILARYTGLPTDTLAAVASRTAGASGAELEAVARDARRLARGDGEPVDVLHLLTAASGRTVEHVKGCVDLADLTPGPGVMMH